jgi:aromatic ring-opening dioxygenase catalytic subunit (LigB family)
MASFAGAYAASHGPLIIREWARVPADEKERMSRAYRELGRRIAAAQTDVLIVIAPDHWSNFFLDNIPTVCLGVGETHDGPPEPWMKDFPHRQMPGHPQFAMHVADTALAQGFEPSISHRLKLDHGFCIPLWKMDLERLPRIVPLVVNSIEPPLPSLARCYQWGTLLRRAIDSYPDNLRVAVLGTGGLSHSIGEKTMGAIYEEFDRETLRFFGRPERELIQFLDAKLATSGNGSEEVRNWLVAHGAAGGRGFELVDYLPVPAVIVGCGFAAWRAQPPS